MNARRVLWMARWYIEGPSCLRAFTPFPPSVASSLRRFVAWSLPILLFAACSPSDPPTSSLTLATTTTTQDSGLIDVLMPMFRQQTGVDLRVVAVGTGQALQMGQRGDADVLFTHAPDAEQRFIEQGHGVQRIAVMHNQFVVVGPGSDPAGLGKFDTVVDVFQTLAQQKALFISRGDQSGTHMKELAIWRACGITPHVAPDGDWYIQAGAGMTQTLRVADQKRAYTLSARGTFLAQRGKLELSFIFDGDPRLANQYSVLLLNPERHPHLNHDGAKRFAAFVRMPQTQQVIAKFGVKKFGEPLFFVDGFRD